MAVSEDKSGSAAAEKPPSREERLLEAKVRTARRALLFEKLWPRVWLPLAICGIFVLLSAFEVWQLLPPRVHLGLLWAFGAALGVSLMPLVLWRKPTREKSLARIEQASALEHRPLTAYNDTLSQDAVPPETAALWKAHRARAAKALAKLKAGPARPRVDRYDPFALRALLILILVAVMAWSWTDLPGRVFAAFNVPEIPLGGASFRIDAWISPPAYTRKEPFVLGASAAASGNGTATAVPEGSVLTVKINGSGARNYRVSLTSGEESQKLDPSGESGDAYAEYTQKIDRSTTLAVGGTFGSVRSWPLTAVPDRAPTIGFVGPIEVSHRAVMLLKYKADDDYGVMSAEAHVERVIPGSEGAPDSGQKPQIGKPPVFALSLPRAPIKSAEGKTYKDLTAHPWAGLPVVVTLTAKDEAGHVGYSVPRGLILPERKFTKPLAKTVIDQRRSLVENPADTARVAANLNALGSYAEDEGAAPTVYLGLRSAYWRLRTASDIGEVESAVDQLWDVAVRIEDGNLSSAERDLRAAQERLKEAIERGASQDEIQKLMSELRQALNTYLQALRQQEGKNSQNAMRSPNAKSISAQDLQNLLDKIENLAKAGSPEAAAQMLNELRDILESIQSAKAGSEEEDKENLQRLDRMTDILRQQQQLLDDTFRKQQEEDSDQGGRDQLGPRSQQRGQRREGEPGPQQGKSASDLKKRQNDIQRQLEELLSGMGAQDKNPVVKKLEEAGGAMGNASEALNENELGEAGEQEGRAVESLRQGARSMAEQMARSGNGRGGSQANRDPLGRKQGDRLDDGESVKVPDEITVQRARAILEELRKRLGQPSRPPLELDYLERLVKPY